jgi:hypothetical protein
MLENSIPHATYNIQLPSGAVPCEAKLMVMVMAMMMIKMITTTIMALELAQSTTYGDIAISIPAALLLVLQFFRELHYLPPQPRLRALLLSCQVRFEHPATLMRGLQLRLR